MKVYWFEGEVMDCKYGPTPVNGNFTTIRGDISPLDQLVAYLAKNHTDNDKTKVTIHSMRLFEGS